MIAPTPYLDWVIVASAAYPSGLGYSVYAGLWGTPRHVSSLLLGMLALPFVVVVPAVSVLRPGLIDAGPSPAWLIAAAVVLAPVALLCEFAIHGVAAWRATGAFPRAIAVHGFWRGRLAPQGHLLLAIIAIGEECFYRAIWMGVLIASGVAVPAALAISSLAYGVNHLSFGGASVVSKTVTGFLYGALYLAGGLNIALPILTHVLQNAVLLGVTGRRHG